MVENTPPGAAASSAAPTRAPAGGLYRHYVLVLLTLVYSVNVIDRYIVSILTEDLKATFQVSDGWIGALSGLGFALVYATAGIPIAYLADRSNRRNIIAGALALFSAATIACGAAANFAQLLVARLVVGIGEAGTSPPSHSMLSDLYDAKSRPAALGVFSAGASIGLLTAFMVGGWVTQTYGWRTTFLVAGIPGLILALLVLFTAREPIRGALDAGMERAAAPSPREVVKYLLSRPSYVQLCIATSLWSFVAIGSQLWAAPFLIRAHGLDVATVGMVIGLLAGMTGFLGALLGGFVTSHLGARNPRYYLLLPMAVVLLSLPLFLAFYLVPSTPLAIACYIIPGLATYFCQPPALATALSVVPPRMRATTSAIFFFAVNIVGLMLGPTMVGILSDIFSRAIDVSAVAPEAAAAYATAEGLRWALVACSFVALWSAFHYYLASRTIKADMERVGETRRGLKRDTSG